MLRNAKDLLAGYTLSTVIPREHSDRGNLAQYVILSATKDPLAGYTLSTRVVAGRLYVILSETKDLKACTTVHRHGDLEILHSVQNDRASVQNDRA